MPKELKKKKDPEQEILEKFNNLKKQLLTYEELLRTALLTSTYFIFQNKNAKKDFDKTLATDVILKQMQGVIDNLNKKRQELIQQINEFSAKLLLQIPIRSRFSDKDFDKAYHSFLAQAQEIHKQLVEDAKKLSTIKTETSRQAIVFLKAMLVFKNSHQHAINPHVSINTLTKDYNNINEVVREMVGGTTPWNKFCKSLRIVGIMCCAVGVCGAAASALGFVPSWGTSSIFLIASCCLFVLGIALIQVGRQAATPSNEKKEPSAFAAGFYVFGQALKKIDPKKRVTQYEGEERDLEKRRLLS